MNKKRWASLILILGAAVFAWFGGEFSTPEYFEMKRAEVAARDSLSALRQAVDSLTLFRDSLTHLPGVQERFAREHWGMLRPGELTFEMVPDTTR